MHGPRTRADSGAAGMCVGMGCMRQVTGVHDRHPKESHLQVSCIMHVGGRVAPTPPAATVATSTASMQGTHLFPPSSLWWMM